MATEKGHRAQLQVTVQEAAAPVSSRTCSHWPKNGLSGSEQISSAARQDRLTQSISEQYSLWEESKVDLASTAPPTVLDHQLPDVNVPAQSTRSKASLMKKLSLLLHPGKKSKSKSGGGAQKPLLPSMSHATEAGGAGRELELLFAQAEATLGELLVRAGASFDARSSSTSHHAAADHHPSYVRGRRNGDAEATLLGSSSGRSAGISTGQGHARRKSLSRVWQQLGGSLFCGSGHMNGYVTEELPLPAHTSATASYSGIYEDVALDEAYWQSVADAMLMQRHQHAKVEDNEVKLPSDKILHHQSQVNIEVQANEGHDDDSHHDFSFVIDSSQQQQQQQHSGDMNVHDHHGVSDEEADGESEIVASIDPGSMCKWSACSQRSGLDYMNSMYYENFTGVQGGAGSTSRLNTTLDDSPNLAHNYQLHMDSAHVILSCSSTATSTVQMPLPSSVPAAAEAATARPIIISSQVVVEASPSMQPLERFLCQARGAGGGRGPPSEDASSPSSESRSAPDLTNNYREPALSAGTTSTSCRVSLMTLLHEEAAAIDFPPAVEMQKEEEEEEVAEEAAAPAGGGVQQGRRRMTRFVGEDPLLCCVCMVRRKGAALIPCGHTFCRICSKQLFAGRGACPLCNNLIVQVLDIF